jgi:choline dehydrogenase
MGRKNDSMAVIDSQARVIGVHNLRVVDASSFPLLPPGHPASTTRKLQDASPLWK